MAGRPGGYASFLANKARAKAGLCVALAAASIWVFSRNFQDLTAPAPAPILPAAAMVVTAVCSGLFRVFAASAAAASVGAKSERRVAKRLVGLNPVAVLNSVDLDAGGDADHMVIGPKLLVVETKTGNGPVRYEDGKLYVGNKALRGDPVAQCRRQALAAKRMLSTFCDAVVCVVDMQNSPFTVSSVVVCSLNDLPAVLHRCQDRMPAPAALRHATALAPRCSTIHNKTDSDPSPDPTPVGDRVGNKSGEMRPGSKATMENSPSRRSVAPDSTPDPALSARTDKKAKPATSPAPLRKLTPRRSPR